VSVTDGTLLGGRVTYRQFETGHRSGFEPVLLAAAVPAKAGERVLEAGTGAGAGLLCLAARVPGILATGLDIDPALAALANENFKINGLNDFVAVEADAAAPPALLADHIFANPPWHDPAGTKSPDGGRALAHHAAPGLMAAWVAGLAPRLLPGGSFTLILPAAELGRALAALAPKHGALTVFPLWPRAGQPARQVIVSARKGAKSPMRLLPGLVLHGLDGITPEAQAVLRDGAGLAL
jgi:tRNA1(Val) A37 N6-methylase TrmN6